MHQLQLGDGVEQHERAAQGHEDPGEHESERAHDAVLLPRRITPHGTILTRRLPQDRARARPTRLP